MSDYRKFERVVGPHAIPAENARSPWLTCEAYYGLREKPFALASDPRFFYQSHLHAAAYETLLAGIRRRESLSVVSGEIGTGKTTLCRAVLQNLDRQTFSAFVPDPFASREDLLKMVLMDFGVISVDDLTSGRLSGAHRTELSYLLYEFLRKLAPLQAFAVVVIDEAQNLSLSLLEEIRILSDSDGRERQLQVVLVGQPELQEKLMMHEVRQIEQRVTVRCHLDALTRDAVAGYVSYRLQIADGTPDRIFFTPDAIDVVYEGAHGVPRLINRICDRALHHGHQKRRGVIDADIVRAAIGDIGISASKASVTPAAAPQAATASAPSEAPAGAAAEAAAEVGDPAAPSDKVDEWLSSIAAPTVSESAPISAAEPRETHSNEYSHPAVPRTYLERLVRRWLFRIATIAMWVGGIAVAGIVALFVVTTLQQQLHQPVVVPFVPPATPALKPALQPPAHPGGGRLLPAGSFMLHVAQFSTEADAANTVDALSLAGYVAYSVPLSFGTTVRYQVVAGPYETLTEADAATSRLRITPGFEDARLVHLTPQ